jgi:geranylgeranyl diphosphate synthase, type II
MEKLQHYSTFLEEKISAYHFSENPKNLYDPLRYFMTLGGKRIRPLLTLMSGNVFQLTNEECLPAALCIEFFHNFSLIHDDIMDLAPVRRGKTTVHEKWNSNIAILSGDVLKYKDDRLPQLLKRFNETAIEVCEGQQMDMDFETRHDVSIDEYIEMIRLKTSVLIGCALEFGGILAKQSVETCRSLYNFGVELGIAFQIQDDLLDLYGNPETFGKQIGGDVIANKKTLLWLTANQLSPNEIEYLTSIESLEEKVSKAKIIFEQCGAKEKTEAEMNTHYEKAMSSLNSLELNSDKKTPLIELAKFLLNRTL